MTAIRITRAGPLCTIQDAGRSGMLRYGISASGPMDRSAWHLAGSLAGGAAGAAIEFTAAGLALTVEGTPLRAGCAGGDFVLHVNGDVREWPARLDLKAGDRVQIAPGRSGNYGYLRFDRALDIPQVLGSQSTNLVVGLGGFDGRALRAGDTVALGPTVTRSEPPKPGGSDRAGAIRFVWGLHADIFSTLLRQRFTEVPFTVSTRIDRMGARLADRHGVFAGRQILSLVSDAIVPGDVQILGDGTPIVLLRDHQPTGGYPRLATVIGADLGRFAQLRPGTEVRFEAVTVARAQAALKGHEP